MISSRERFLQTLLFTSVQTPWVRWGSFLWDETLKRWRTEGYDGRNLDDMFGLDQLVRVDPWYGPVPDFEYRVVEEDDRTVTYINNEGILMREFKERRDTSMPQFLGFPVQDQEEFEQFAAERLALKPEVRLAEDWKRQVSTGGRSQVNVGKAEELAGDRQPENQTATIAQQEEWPRLCWADRWGGFFGPLRNLMGVQELCYAFYDQPKLIERMMSERADAMTAVTAEVLKYTQIDTFWFWEDMAYNHGPLVNPDVFRKFALPHYRRVCNWLREQGIQHIGLDSDGNIARLIPIWLEGGINMLWPFEHERIQAMIANHKFGACLPAFGNCADRYCLSGYGGGGTNMQEMLDLATQVDGLDGLELVGNWHVNDARCSVAVYLE